MSLAILKPGLLSLIQDRGRFGHHRIGLTNGGPLDPRAYDLCNRLLGNDPGSPAVEVSFGGLEVEARVDTFICLTGAAMPLLVNGDERDSHRVHRVRAGDRISLEFARHGCRAYLGVACGFEVEPVFASASTVVREGIGGLDGMPLRPGDILPCGECRERPLRFLPPEMRPHYHDTVTIRVIPGYQQARFSRYQQRRFFSHAYAVSDRCDRMGYRLEGPPVTCDIDRLLSEGICHGAIQIPADGQPIVLLNDRQTIGGYPKIGSALSLDTAQLAQARPGATVNFTPISLHAAHNALHLADSYARRQQLPELR